MSRALDGEFLESGLWGLITVLGVVFVGATAVVQQVRSQTR